MQTALLFLFASAVYVASAMPAEDVVVETEERYVQIPDGKGGMRTIDLETDQPDLALLESLERNPNNNRYFLWTRETGRRNSQQLILNNANSVRNSFYNPNRQTVVVVHGWLSNQNTDLNPVIRDAYLGKYDVNVIVMDWRRLALSDYYTAARGVPAAGRGLGQFVQWLINTAGGNLNNFHLVGFSLGAHLVGNAGRVLGGRAARVTGLDPAGPLWVTSSNRLNPNDGVYVEAIHTDGNAGMGLGIGRAVANADFFPNGGNNQPGCLSGLCDHNRAWELFAATVTHNHLVARGCSNSLQITYNNCRGASFHMGNADLRKSGSGLFRVNTGRRYPF